MASETENLDSIVASETENLDSETDRLLAKRVYASHHHHHHGQWRCFPLFAATIAVIVATASVTVADDSLAFAADGDRHFVRISTHGIPFWNADAELFSSDGTFQKDFYVSSKNGGHVTWYFTEQKGWTLNANVYNDGQIVTITKQPLDRDYCFLVKAFGDIKYTGDSKTGGCTDK